MTTLCRRKQRKISELKRQVIKMNITERRLNCESSSMENNKSDSFERKTTFVITYLFPRSFHSKTF